MTESIQAAGLVIYRKVVCRTEYLLLQTSYGEHHWTPPKGIVEQGEAEIDTAWRETEEESGLTKSDLHLTDFTVKTEYLVNGKPKTVLYWLAELRNETPIRLSSEHQDYKWLPIVEACKIVQYKNMQEVLMECSKYLLNKK